MVFIFSEAGPCPKHSEALVGIRTALWRAPLAFTSMVIADTDEKEAPKDKKKKRATFNLIKKQRKLEPPGGTGDLLWSQWNVVKGTCVEATLPTGQATGLGETPKCNMNDCNSTNLISSDNPLFYELQDEEEALSPVKTRFTKYQLFCNTYFRLFSPRKKKKKPGIFAENIDDPQRFMDDHKKVFCTPLNKFCQITRKSWLWYYYQVPAFLRLRLHCCPRKC